MNSLAVNGGSSFDRLPSSVRGSIFSFLSVRELGALSRVSRACAEDVSESVWKCVYSSSFAHPFRLVRPFGRASIGWRVSVASVPPLPSRDGTVLDFRNDKFLILYDPITTTPTTLTTTSTTLTTTNPTTTPAVPNQVWERETFTTSPWYTAGRPRITFLSAPAPRKFSAASTAADESDGLAAPVLLPADLPVQASAHGWKWEAANDRMSAPTKLTRQTVVHEDEVLCVAFSECGKKLATCSRDGFTKVFSTTTTTTTTTTTPSTTTVNRGSEEFGLEPILTIQHQQNDVPCRVSINGDYLLISTESSHNTGPFPVSPAKLEGYCGITGRRLFSRPNSPFDVCGEWLGRDSGFFLGGESLAVSMRGTYHQTLGIFDFNQPNKALVKIQLRFAQQAFVHLCRIRDGLLAMSCGAGEALSDVVRVLGLPGEEELRGLASEGEVMMIRVPKMKWEKTLAGVEPHVVENVVPSFFCGGAVLAVEWSKKVEGRLLVNVRPYVKVESDVVVNGLARPIGVVVNGVVERPDLSNTVELQVWDVKKKKLVSRIPGACGLTTKECPFYLFLCESPCGEYVASGSEDAGVYMYHVRHAKLVRVLKGHGDVVSSVTWWGRWLVSAADDKTICVWEPSGKRRKIQ